MDKNKSPADEQIKKWRERWDKYPGLADEIAVVLMEGKPAETGDEAAKRMWQVNELIREKGGEDFDIYEGRGFGFSIGSQKVLVPKLDLRGIDWKEKELQKIVCPFVHFKHAHLEGSDLSVAHFEGADLSNAHIEDANLYEAHIEGAWLDWVHLEGADLWWAHIKGTNLTHAHLEGANLMWAHLEGSYLWGAHLEGADLWEAHLEGADLSLVSFGKIEKLSDNCKLSSERLEKLSEKPTTFASTEFLPRWWDLLFERNSTIKSKFVTKWLSWLHRYKLKLQFINLLRFNFNRWFYTNFRGVMIDDADTVEAGDLYRYVKDQQFLYRFKDRHPVIYWIWKIFTDCGGSMAVVAFWAFLIIWVFAGIYANAPFETPHWLLTYIPDFLIVNAGEGLIQQDKLMNVSPVFRWFFVSFDVFTNLGIRNMNPLNDAGVVVVFLETVMGYVTLGMLISVLTSKYARRS